jgi:HNH endonuclease
LTLRTSQRNTSIAVDIDERFWSKISIEDQAFPENDCMIWTASRARSRNGNGGGTFSADGKTVMAYRWAYERYRGPIPEGLVCDHLCRDPMCVNPDHIEIVTRSENNKRGLTGHQKKSRNQHTHQRYCKRGHEFTAENTYTRIQQNGKPRRYCNACRKGKLWAHFKRS